MGDESVQIQVFNNFGLLFFLLVQLFFGKERQQRTEKCEKEQFVGHILKTMLFVAIGLLVNREQFRAMRSGNVNALMGEDTLKKKNYQQ